jgi:hypothetical protein
MSKSQIGTICMLTGILRLEKEIVMYGIEPLQTVPLIHQPKALRDDERRKRMCFRKQNFKPWVLSFAFSF